MSWILTKVMATIGVEKLFLLAWNALLPVLAKKAKESGALWDDKALEFFNSLVLIFTGKAKDPADDKHPDVVKPEALVELEKRVREVK